MQTRDWIEGGLRLRRGRVHLPTGPGLGARPTAAWLARHPAE